MADHTARTRRVSSHQLQAHSQVLPLHARGLQQQLRRAPRPRRPLLLHQGPLGRRLELWRRQHVERGGAGGAAGLRRQQGGAQHVQRVGVAALQGDLRRRRGARSRGIPGKRFDGGVRGGSSMQGQARAGGAAHGHQTPLRQSLTNEHPPAHPPIRPPCPPASAAQSPTPVPRPASLAENGPARGPPPLAGLCPAPRGAAQTGGGPAAGRDARAVATGAEGLSKPHAGRRQAAAQQRRAPVDVSVPLPTTYQLSPLSFLSCPPPSPPPIPPACKR